MLREGDRPAARPSRYMRDRAHSARVTAPLRPFAWPAPDATPQEADQLRRALLERDEPSAALVRAIREDRTVTLAQFRQALAEGVDSVPDAPVPLRDYFALIEDTPDWVDRDLVALGARTLRRVGSDAGDVLAWLASLTDQLGLSLDDAAARYANGCPRCGASPCACR